ncbi:hypothetical protein BhenCHDE101_07395 [Bartonella henselae]|nr:hypothetical protein BhenCHDE101_07395 [Bartonella henselae]PNM38980.1 hypothetical protein AL470_006710 [Bartonella henselae str. Houston-1]
MGKAEIVRLAAKEQALQAENPLGRRILRVRGSVRFHGKTEKLFASLGRLSEASKGEVSCAYRGCGHLLRGGS